MKPRDLYKAFHDTRHAVSRGDFEKGVRTLDNIFFRRTGLATVNPNTHQKFIFCARQHTAVGLALYIFPGQPGAAS